MEVPEFCTRPAARRSKRKRKTEEELDPDYNPKQPRGDKEEGSEAPGDTMPSEYPSSGEEETPAEDKEWEPRKVGRPSKKQAGAGGGPEGKMPRGRAKRKNEFDASLLKPLHDDTDPFANYLEGKNITIENFRMDSIPKWAMDGGLGLGGEQSNKFEFKSVWNNELTPYTVADATRNLEGLETTFPWNQKDVSKPDFAPEIISVVGSFTLGRRLDLLQIAEASRNVEFNPERYAPLIMRIREPKVTGLIFSSGRVIVTGAKSVEECRKAGRKFARVIQRQGHLVKMIGFSIQNLSAHCHLGFRVRLHQLALNKMYGNLSYEPELFPGVIIPLEFPKVKVIIFCSGSVLLTGARREEDLLTAYNAVYPLVKLYAP